MCVWGVGDGWGVGGSSGDGGVVCCSCFYVVFLIKYSTSYYTVQCIQTGGILK